MMKSEFRVPLAISIAAHAVLIALIVWGAYHVIEAEFPGTNAVVGVWIEGPEGGEPGLAGGKSGVPKESPEKSRPEKKARKKIQAEQRRESGTLPVVGTAEEPATAGEKKGAEGEGAGAGEGGAGAGLGGGSGGKGNPVLAAIWRRINSHKYYPSSARRKGLIGSPRVTFTINKDGSIGWVKLATSCGETELDAAAVETVQRSAPLPYYAGAITLAVRYSLER